MINVLMVAADRDFAGVLDLNQAMARLKERAERKEAGLFGRTVKGWSILLAEAESVADISWLAA